MSGTQSPPKPSRGLGARYLGGRRALFELWAPAAGSVELRLVRPFEKTLPMERAENGCFTASAENVEPGSRYLYRLDGKTSLPDPASRWQPEGAGGPSEVADPEFPWEDKYWCGLPLHDLVLYELHVGTFAPEGSFGALLPRLDELKELGVTALCLMPVGQMPGGRGWGLECSHPFAVHHAYGGPKGLKALVDACHRRGLAVILDFPCARACSHLDPFGPYRKDGGYNLDGPGSDHVRRFLFESALQWLGGFHADGLRVTEAPADRTARTFLEELSEIVHSYGRGVNRLAYLIGPDMGNDPRIVRQAELGGMGLDAHACPDFHQALHALLTGERGGAYRDFGSVSQLAKAYSEGYVLGGQHSLFRGRRHGAPSGSIAHRRFVVWSQDHACVGGRPLGERHGSLLSFESQKLAAGALLLSPCVPLLFMGQEYGEKAPFHRFLEGDVSEGLLEELRRTGEGLGQTGGAPPPSKAETFEDCRLEWELRGADRHQLLLKLYRELSRLRKEHPALKEPGKTEAFADEDSKSLLLHRAADDHEVLAVFHFHDVPSTFRLSLPEGAWDRLLDSSDLPWGGTGTHMPGRLRSDPGGSELRMAPKSFALYEKAPPEIEPAPDVKPGD